ncbi:hypothetical protein V6260_19555, partial [Pseudoalteromonas aliena]|uniref:hypothetical protein n=1 Tax=Pseudoalteromonas aliena TaxID=247523 RepID=UPI00311FD344
EKSGKQHKIYTGIYDLDGITQYTWSPNSQYIVYVKNNENRYASLCHYNIKKEKVTLLTDEMSNEQNPT